MTRFLPALPLLLSGLFLTACAPATPDSGAGGASAPISVQAQHAPAVACPAAQSNGAVTSKGRHIPDESDPCADSRGAVAH